MEDKVSGWYTSDIPAKRETAMRLRFSAFAALATLAVCAAGPVHAAQPGLQSQADLAGDPRLGEQVDRICTGRSITGFSDVSEHALVVRAGRDRHYLIETAGACEGQEQTRRLAFDQFSTCLAPGDRILSSNATPQTSGSLQFEPREMRRSGLGCQITAIYRWNPDARAADAANPSGSSAQR
jgi:hypothetical protein